MKWIHVETIVPGNALGPQKTLIAAGLNTPSGVFFNLEPLTTLIPGAWLTPAGDWTQVNPFDRPECDLDWRARYMKLCKVLGVSGDDHDLVIATVLTLRGVTLVSTGEPFLGVDRRNDPPPSAVPGSFGLHGIKVEDPEE